MMDAGQILMPLCKEALPLISQLLGQDRLDSTSVCECENRESVLALQSHCPSCFTKAHKLYARRTFLAGQDPKAQQAFCRHAGQQDSQHGTQHLCC